MTKKKNQDKKKEGKEKKKGDQKKKNQAEKGKKKSKESKDKGGKKGKEKEKKKEKEERKIESIRPGYIVKVEHLSPEGDKSFTSEGVVMRVRGEGRNKTFTLRRIVQGVGVEQVFNLFSPALKKLKVLKKQPAKKARLYFLRSDKVKPSKKSRYLKK